MTGNDDVCWVCGGDGANILCKGCGHLVCPDCYDEATKRCLECIETSITSKVRTRKLMLVGGLLMIVIGLSTAAAGIVSGIPVESITVVFPFIVGDVSPWVAGVYSFLFFLTISTASFIPWYIHTRAKPVHSEGEDITVIEGNISGGDNFEHVEYVITAELPKKLEKTIMVESNGSFIHLHSTFDKYFDRNYRIPDGHDLEGLDYDYEEGYLVLRLHLVRIP